MHFPVLSLSLGHFKVCISLQFGLKDPRVAPTFQEVLSVENPLHQGPPSRSKEMKTPECEQQPAARLHEACPAWGPGLAPNGD